MTTTKTTLISTLLLTSLLKGDVDIARISGKWLRQEAPQALTTKLKADGIECHDYFTTADGTAVLIHNSKKFPDPVDPSLFDKGLESFKTGFEKAAAKAKEPLYKNEIVEADGVRLLHQEIKQDGSAYVVLNQMTPTRSEQIILNVPAADRDALVAVAYSLFRPLPPPAVAASTPAASRPSENSTPPAPSSDEDNEAYKMGHRLGTISMVVILVALVLTACGVMRFSKKTPR